MLLSRADCYNSTITSSPFTLIGYTATLAPGLCTASPVFGSHCQPCHGQTSLFPSMTPCPSGPPRCRQTLSMAVIVPFTLATQITLSPQGNSLASPSDGSSDWVVSLVSIQHSALSRMGLLSADG